MSQSTVFYPLGGGLDLITPAISLKPGKVIASRNYEPVESGYQRIEGFERFDGRPKPSAAGINYLPAAFEAGTALGDLIVGETSGATGQVLAPVQVGALYVGLTGVTGEYEIGENILVDGVPVGVVSAALVRGYSPDEEVRATWEANALSLARGVIQSVPGAGPVRGVWKFGGTVYAFRDNAEQSACEMWSATAGGWAQVQHGSVLPFTSGSTEPAPGDIVTGATSGATAVVRRVVRRSGSWGSGDVAGYLAVDTVVGTFQSENLDILADANVATIAGPPTAHSFPAGGRYEFLNHNFYGASNLRRMYGVNGVGSAFEFDGTTIVPILTEMPDDRPIRIAVHRMHLFLAFPGGSVQFSEPGEPMLVDPILGAGEFAIGDEVTDFISNNTEVLTILGANSVSNLYGNDASDFQLQVLADDAGALPWTAEKIGSAIYMDNRGLRSMSSTQAYGNFSLGTLTAPIAPYLRERRTIGVQPVAACRVRTKNQYKVFYDNGEGLTVFVGRKEAESMPFNLGRVVSCICSVEGEDRNEEIFFGATDGFVYQLNAGNSFDGEPLDYFLRLPFNHLGAPQQRKRWHRMVLECEATPQATLRVSCDFNYGDGSDLSSVPEELTVTGGGGQWDSSLWDTFLWDGALEGQAEAYIDGVGKNISILIAGSAVNEGAHLLQGITLFFTPRGLQR